jgi:hypothetical protein
MSRESRPPRSRTDRERLVGVLVPGPIGRPPPSPPPLPALPSLRLPTDAGPDAALLDLARLDRSGRVYARPLLDALGWSAGHRVDIAVVAGVLVVGSKPGGLHVVGSRGVLTLPAARASSLMSARTTAAAPAWANAWGGACPRREPAPVTSATWPVKS